MTIFLIAMGLVALGGLASLAASRSARTATAIGAGTTVAGCALALVPAVLAALGAESSGFRAEWSMPGGSFSLALDPLTGFFLVPTLLLSALAAVYGAEYLMAYDGRKSLGAAWLCFNLLVVSMAAVLTARNAVLFLIAWETMALTSFFLVTFENEKQEVRDAGWTYMIATHLGTAFLLVMFLLMNQKCGSFDFDKMGALANLSPALAGLIFICAVIGFGTKAGFMPLHVWLPEAHPAAPSHVSALMSGVMIKTGIYGLIRMLMLLGEPPAWWGWTLVAVGLVSGILGILFAMAQRDFKRMLAYSSVENVGIITLGLGLGLLGVSHHLPTLAVLGFAGALLHVLNHAMFKGLLFLAAGSVLHATGSRTLDRMGGLMKRMPWTGALFVVGAVAICGLPPLNGFVGEFLVYLGAFKSASGSSTAPTMVPAILAIAGLALIGGLAAACFTKAFGIVFLGEPRSDSAAHGHEPGLAMKLPMLVLAGGCVVVGIFPSPVVKALYTVVEPLVGSRLEPAVLDSLTYAGGLLAWVAIGGCVFLALVVALVLLRRRLLAGRQVEETVTWDCGYARPTARMQYTASSFAQPLTTFFSAFLQGRRKLTAPDGIFPKHAELSTETPDACRQRIFGPTFAWVDSWMGRLRVLQRGRVQLYALYIVLTLLALMIWKLG